MKDIREMFNISYFDNKELSLKEHCDIYSNIRKDLISILNKYDIKYVVADTESIRDLSKENKSLKKQLEEANENIILLKASEPMLEWKKELEENQQKEFIKWLEYEIEKATTNPYTKLSEYGMNRIHIYKEILQKYKSIIGVSDEKK